MRAARRDDRRLERQAGCGSARGGADAGMAQGYDDWQATGEAPLRFWRPEQGMLHQIALRVI